ncbi:hypothetical protein [Antricoccus suffuscus]|nr:hypothetical protein [Antricoccus suffuscus]
MPTKNMLIKNVPTRSTPAGGTLTPPRPAQNALATAGPRKKTPAWLALVWSVLLGALSILWLTGVLSFPFHGPGASLLDTTTPATAQVILLGIAIAGLALSAPHVLRVAPRSRTLAVTTLLLPVMLIYVIPDYRVLAAVGYLPVMLVMVISGTESLSIFGQVWTGSTVILAAGVLAGLCFTVLAVRSWPKTRTRISTPRLLLVGRVAAYIAAAIPVGYAVTRIAWALGIPLGISESFLKEIDQITNIGLGLGLFAIVGAILTLGLVQRWGTIFPRWMLGLRGRPVPVGLAVNSALIVSLLVSSAGIFIVRGALSGDLALAPNGAASQVAAWLPEMFWPLWGAALATAALAYRERRRRAAHDERQEHLLAAVDDRRTP